MLITSIKGWDSNLASTFEYFKWYLFKNYGLLNQQVMLEATISRPN